MFQGFANFYVRITTKYLIIIATNLRSIPSLESSVASVDSQKMR